MEITQQTLITEKQIIAPLELVLNEATPQIQKKSHDSSNNPKSINDSLDTLFPEQKYEEKDIQKAKEALGPIANKFTTEELKGVIADVQFLVDTWLDDFERDVFDGLTLKELLHEKGGI
jgi:hypothetical protein